MNFSSAEGNRSGLTCITASQAVWNFFTPAALHYVESAPPSQGDALTPQDIPMEVRRITGLLTNLCLATSQKQVVGLIGTYVLASGSTESWSDILEYLQQNVLDTTAQAQTSDVHLPDWLIALKKCQADWRTMTQSKTKTQIERLLGILVAFGLCEAANVTFNIGRFKLFQPAKIESMDLPTILDVLFELGIYFIETGYCAWATSSPRLLLVGVSGYDLDTEFHEMIRLWDLYEHGNLEKVAQVREIDFRSRLTSLHTNLQRLLENSSSSFEKNLLAKRKSEIGALLANYAANRIGGIPKVRPYMIELCGDSAVGKSPMMDCIIQCLLTSRNLPIGPGTTYTRDSKLKYWDGCTSNMIAVKLDDPTFSKDMNENYFADDLRIIANNQATAVNMSDVKDKGKVIPEFQVSVTSTNQKDLRASEIAADPWSFQRRQDIVLSVKVRQQFQISEENNGLCRVKVANYYMGQPPPIIEDLWLITVEKPVQSPRVGYNCNYEVVLHNGRRMEDVPLELVVQYLIEQFDEHMNFQESFVANKNAQLTGISVCSHPGCKQIAGHCSEHPVVAPAEMGFASTVKRITRRGVKILTHRSQTVEDRICLAMILQAEWFFRFYDFLKFLPSWAIHIPGFAAVMATMDKWNFAKSYTWENLRLFCIFFPVYYCFSLYRSKIAVAIGVVLYTYRIKHYTRRAMEIYTQRLVRRNALSVLATRRRDACVNAAIAASTAIGLIYTCFKARVIYKELSSMYDETIRPYFFGDDEEEDDESDSASPPEEDKKPLTPMTVTAKPHGSFEPTTRAEIANRDASYNDWGEVCIRPINVSPKSKSITHSDLLDKVKQHLFYAQLVCKDGSLLMVQILVLSSGYCLLPYHYFQEHESFEVTGFRDSPTKSGGRIATRLSRTNAVRLANHDLCICGMDTGGHFGGIIDYLPEEVVERAPFKMVRRRKTGDVSLIPGRCVKGLGTHTMQKDFPALLYEYLAVASQQGWCGAPLVTDTKYPCIAGVHVGGADLKHSGMASSFTRSEVLEAIELLTTRPGNLMPVSVISTPNMGTVKFDAVKPHPKSPLNYLPPESQLMYHGHTGKCVKPTHTVKNTPISSSVERIFDVTNNFRPPKINPNWWGLQKTVSAAAIPGLPHDHKIMEIAANDYMRAASEVFSQEIWEDTAPLTNHQVVNGIPGVKFIDPIKSSTSAYPYAGTKIEYLEGEPGNREFIAEIRKEFFEAEQMLARGERPTFVSKTCLKSEPYDKDKCRYFFVAHLIMTMAIRKYFLPLIRVIQMNPFVFECAVGLNAHGPDWQALHEHVTKYGTERIIAGDYREYDTRIPAQDLKIGFWMLCKLATQCNYTPRHLRIMHTLAHEVIFPFVDVNGDLVSFTEGTHISGNSLTVILNSLAGSINMRCFFYTLYPASVKFQDAVALITYGDDNAGSVAEGYEKFNIKTFAAYLSNIGQIYTMPDKEQELQPYLDFEDFEFLKRKSVWHEELNVHIGALVPKSIMKSLLSHNYDARGNPLSEIEVTAQAMDSAAIEMFNHGKQFYDENIAKLREVAKDCEMFHMCRNLDNSYDYRVEEWKAKYLPPPADPSSASIAKNRRDVLDTIQEDSQPSRFGLHHEAIDIVNSSI